MGREIVGLEGPIPPGATMGGHGAGYVGMVGAAYHPPPTSPQPWGRPLPGDHLWAQLCFLLGDTGAEGTTFAHPVGLQSPEARGHRCYLLQVVSLDPPIDADPTSPAK